MVGRYSVRILAIQGEIVAVADLRVGVSWAVSVEIPGYWEVVRCYIVDVHSYPCLVQPEVGASCEVAELGIGRHLLMETDLKWDEPLRHTSQALSIDLEPEIAVSPVSAVSI